MTFLAELNNIFTLLNIPVETGVFSDAAPDYYVVITPLSDMFAVHADDYPRIEVQEARISLFSKGNYTAMAREIVYALLAAEFTVTERKYHGYEDETGYHNYSVDLMKAYPFGDKNKERAG